MDIEIQTITSEGFINRPMFHPKAGLHPSGRIYMALQTIGGGDYFGPVEYTFSDDNGCSWSKPEYIDELGWKPEARYSNAFEGVCDTVVNYDPASKCMVFLGHSVYYRNNRFMDTMGHWDKADYAPELRRRGCYSALRPDGTWIKRQIIDPEEFKNNACFMCGCGQRIVRDNGEWLVAFYSQIDKDHPHLFVTVYKLHFTGETFELIEHGNILELHNNRGLLEPQLVDFQGRVILTLRAEDGCAYYSTSADGLNFVPIKPWRYNDGALLETSSTQQHFLWDAKRLFLSYTRKNEVNSRVIRYRAPLYIAEVDPSTMTLMRNTERIVFPLEGDPERPETVKLSGNFMPMQIKDNQWIITDGHELCMEPFTSEVKIAHVTL